MKKTQPLAGLSNADLKKIETDFGQRIDVTRSDEDSARSTKAAMMLTDAGALLNPKPDILEYVGAAAVHIYKAPHMGQLFFVSQHPLGGTPEALADKAVSALRGDVMEAYGRKRQVRRSGW